MIRTSSLERINTENSAANALISLVESGIYEKKKQNEIFLKQAKDHLRKMLSIHEAKRHEFPSINWVAKFVPKKVWETNHSGIIEELLCYVRPEIAKSVIKLDSKRVHESGAKLEAFQKPTSYFIKPSLNKFGHSQIRLVDYLFGGQSVEELVSEIKLSTREGEKYQNAYDKFKETCLRCTFLQKERKVKTPYGSVSMLQREKEWDIERVFDSLGEEFLIRYGKVDMTKIEDFILQGKIPKSVVSAHRVLKDIRLDFIVMDLDSEDKALRYFRNKQIQTSLKKFA